MNKPTCPDEPMFLDEFLPYRLVLVARKVSDSLSDVYAQEFNITVPEWRILAHLGEIDGLNAKHIGDKASMDKSTVSRAVQQLERKGYLFKKKSAQDSRAYTLWLSRSGLKLYKKIIPKALAWEADLLKTLSATEQQTLFGFLQELEKNLTQ